jgi:predicted site-specific integrase-resolvase
METPKARTKGGVMETVDKDTLIGAQRAADILGVDRKTIYRWTKRGILPWAVKLPSGDTERTGNYRYDLDRVMDLKKELESQ